MNNNKKIDQVKNEVKKELKKAATFAKNAGKEIEGTVNNMVQEGEKAIQDAKKTAKRKSIKKELFIEYYGSQINSNAIIKKCTAIIEKKYNVLDIKNIKFYYKIEENKVYCLINDQDTVEVQI